MKYKNIKTGAVIETSCKIKGVNWQELKTAGSLPDKKSTESTSGTDKKAADPAKKGPAKK